MKQDNRPRPQLEDLSAASPASTEGLFVVDVDGHVYTCRTPHAIDAIRLALTRHVRNASDWLFSGGTVTVRRADGDLLDDAVA